MSGLSTKKIFNFIKERLEFEKIETEEAIARSIQMLLGGAIDGLELIEEVDKYRDGVVALLEEEIVCCQREGKGHPVELNTSGTLLINRGKKIQDEYKKFCKYIEEINDWEFEIYCARLLRAIFCDVKETKRSGDGGIDFHGKLKFDNSWLEIFNIIPGVFVFGQVKKYSVASSVPVGDLRDFIGAYSLFRNNHWLEQGNPYRDFNVKFQPYAPVSLIFIATCKQNMHTSAVFSAYGVRLIDIEALFQISSKTFGCK